MGKRTQYEPGTFCWVELATTDQAGAKTFYTDLFGWQAEDNPIGEGETYTMLSLGGDNVAALYTQPADQRQQGIPPNWFSYISVADADAAAARARELGGTVLADAFDVMEFGRMAAIQDPTGAAFGVWQPQAHIGATRVNDPGCLTWNQLDTWDLQTVETFYTGLFGWETENQEEDGAVAYITIKNAGSANGGIMPMTTERHGDAPPHWLPYFTTSSCEATATKARDLGGEVLAGPLDVGNGTIAVIRDPQGAVFALFEGEVDD